MKTLLGMSIPPNVKGLVYLCDYNHKENTIKVVKEILCVDPYMALTLFAEIPNPESQMAYGETHEGFCKDLECLHKNMQDKEWLKELGECV